MSKKRVSYQNLLKQAISEFDTSKTVDVKGPMLDPILKWDGDGELPIYKDAASILERYYFNEKNDGGVEVSEAEYNEDGTEKQTDSEKHGEGAGTEQAGTSDASTIDGAKKEAAKEIAKESKLKDKDTPKAKKYVDEKAKKLKEKKEEQEDEEDEDMTGTLENAVIEKLIAEMEEEEEEEKDESEEDESEEDEEDEDDDEEELKEVTTTYTDDDVAPGMNAPKEKKASGPEDDTSGAGTEQAGTGTAAGEVPDRKDTAEKFVKPKNYNEQEETPTPGDEEAEEEDPKDVDVKLDVDADLKESPWPGTGAPGPGTAKKGEDSGDDEDVYEEAFKLFKEAIEGV